MEIGFDLQRTSSISIKPSVPIVSDLVYDDEDCFTLHLLVRYLITIELASDRFYFGRTPSSPMKVMVLIVSDVHVQSRAEVGGRTGVYHNQAGPG